MIGKPEEREIEAISIGRVVLGSIAAIFGMLGWVVALGSLCL